MRGERGMSDVVETTSDEDGGAQGLEGRIEGAQGLVGWIEGRKEGNAKRGGRARGADRGARGV